MHHVRMWIRVHYTDANLTQLTKSEILDKVGSIYLGLKARILRVSIK